jgi:hypothetical protein
MSDSLPECFLNDLLATGRIRAAADAVASAAALESLPRAILRADISARLELPGNPPALSSPAAVWAGTIFYQACQYLVHREFDAATVRKGLGKPCPQSPSPSVCYSVDLVFRYLPDLLSLARGISQEDPLVEGLLVLARQWPLSSVGVDLPSRVDPVSFITDRCLRTLYAERIIARSDISRLDHPGAADAVREALGFHPELAPAIAAKLAVKK